MYVAVLNLHFPARFPKTVVAAATVIGLRYRSGSIIVSKCTVDGSLFLLFLLADGFTDPKLIFCSAPYDDPRTTSREAVTDQPWNTVRGLRQMTIDMIATPFCLGERLSSPKSPKRTKL